VSGCFAREEPALSPDTIASAHFERQKDPSSAYSKEMALKGQYRMHFPHFMHVDISICGAA